MFANDCNVCEKFKFCSKARIFLVSHRFQIQSDIEFQSQGLFELYDQDLVEKVFNLLYRFRRHLGYKYVFNVNGASIYLQKKDVSKKIDDFVFNPDTKFFEFSSSIS